ncbi:glycosyltransferase family 2 protein [Candidatus Bathyarchaeota archaeon]|nr:glycosyltransferase family 2 protein [Candidatus Bathyarchaeota archaeon]
MIRKPELTVVMPAYNEGQQIEDSLEKVDSVLQKNGSKYEVIVVDDGSLDGTSKKATNYANRNGHVKIVSYERNSGKGHAVKTGFANARSDIIVFIDGDLDVEPEQITPFVKALKHADIVISSKWHPESRVEMSAMRRFLSHGFNLLVRLLTGVKFKDTQTGLKAVKRRQLEKIFPRLMVKRFAFDVELLVLANIHGLKIAELPVKARIKKMVNFLEVWRMLIDLLGIAYRLRVVRWYQRAM